jgi:hypothetical protein
MEILIDFDGTVVTHEFPNIGKDVGAVPVLKRLIEKGHKLILFTMRSDIENPASDNPLIVNQSGNYLTQAVKWFEDNGIELYGVNTNPTQHKWTTSPKAYGQLIIDDIGLGIPLCSVPSYSSRPFVHWSLVEDLLEERGIL